MNARRLSHLLALALLLVAKTSLAAVYTQPSNGGTLDVGDSFRSLRGERVGSQCVSVTPKATAPSSQLVEMDLSEVKSIEQMIDQLNVAAAARFSSGLWRFGASATFMKSSYYRAETVTYLYHVRVVNAISRGYFDLKKEYRALVDKNKLSEFYRRCGDSFVSGIISGGEFFVVFHSEFTNASEAQDFRVQVAGSGPQGGGQASTQHSLDKLTSNSKVEARILRSGVDKVEALPDIEKSTLYNYAKAFNTHIGTGRSIAFESTSYAAFNVPPPDIRESALIRIADALELAHDRASKVQDILSHSNDYAFENKKLETKSLTGLLAELAAFQKQMKELGDVCMEVTSTCPGGPAQGVPDRRLPVRLDLVGGCSRWSDGGECLKCTYTAKQLGASEIAEGGMGLRSTCASMKPSGQVRIEIAGDVRPGYKNKFGNAPGEAGVGWWIRNHIEYRLGAKGSAQSSNTVQQANIVAASVGLPPLSIIVAAPKDGFIEAAMAAEFVQMWPVDHGPLHLDPGVQLTMTALGPDGLAAK